MTEVTKNADGSEVRSLGVKSAAVVTFKHEDETDDGVAVGPVFADDKPVGEIRWPSDGLGWSPAWFRKTQAKKIAKHLGAKFEEI
jgi:hypothetical protein